MKQRIATISLICALFTVSCATSQHAQMIALNQASYDFSCDRSQIQVAPLGMDRYIAEGCFKREIYKCKTGLFILAADVFCKQVLSPHQGLEEE